jgi:hypothetical protein
MSNKVKATKKYPFGKNIDEQFMYKHYFTTQARNTNTNFKEYENYCKRLSWDYKIVCSSWKNILGDLPKNKFDDPLVCELPKFRGKQLNKMSLEELNFYSKQIRDIIIIISECSRRRSEFKEKCIPPILRDTGHEQRIENVVKLNSHCKNQLLKITQELQLRLKNVDIKNPWVRLDST